MLLSHFLSFYKGQSNEQDARTCYLEVENALWQEGILTPLTLLGALATCRVEIGRDYKPKREIITQELANKNYGGRYGNRRGTNDGFDYRGGGYHQLTFKGNYDEFGVTPETILDPKVSALALARFFKSRGANVACDKRDWLECRTIINGINRATKLPNGWGEFEKVVNQFLSKL